MGFFRPGGGPMGFQGWLKLRLSLMFALVFVLLIASCGGEETEGCDRFRADGGAV